MKKTVFKRAAAIASALALVTGSAVSCSGKKASNLTKSNDAKQLMSGSYRAVEMDTDIGYVDSMYRVDENTILLLGYDYENKEQKIYKADNDFANIEEIEFNVGETADNVDVSMNSAVSSDGDIYVMAAFTDYADIERPDFDSPDFDYETFDFEKYQAEIEEKAKYSNKLYVLDLDGKVKLEKEITGLDEYAEESDDYYGKMSGSTVQVGNIIPCGGGKAIISVYTGMGETYLSLDADGNIKEKLDMPDLSYVYAMTQIDEKTLAVSGASDNGMKIVFTDIETLKPTGEELKGDYSNEAFNGTFFAGSGDYKLYSSGSKGLYGIKADGSSDEIVNWLDSDLGDGYVRSLITMDNGDYVVLYYDYSGSKSSGSTFYRLTQRDASELENTKVITIASLSGDWQIRDQVSKFNKSHDGVRFKIVDYSQYDRYDEEKETYVQGAASELKKDIISGNAPDMVFGNDNALTKSLGRKGVFVDLYELLDKDSDLKKEDIMPNILKACEVNGKLLSIADSFTLETVIAKKKNLDKDRWSADELIEAYNNRPDKDMHLYGMDTRDSVMELLVYTFYSLIDFEKSECHFDDPEFKKLLGFMDSFEPGQEFDNYEDPEAQAYYEEMDKYYGNTALKNDKVLITSLYIYEPQELVTTLNGELKGEDIKFVGYPSDEGQGSMMSLSSSFSILETSENKDLCWELIKGNFKELTDEDEKEGYYRNSFGMSALKKNFERQLKMCMSKPYYYDENGKKQEYDYTYYDDKGENEIKVDPLSQEQIDFLSDYITNTTKVIGALDPDIESIVEEEITAYIKGEKTAEEAANLLQSRISLILSEQS